MRWVPTGVLMGIALVIIYKCFFDYGQEWMMIPAALLCIVAVAINWNVPSNEPDGSSPAVHNQNDTRG